MSSGEGGPLRVLDVLLKASDYFREKGRESPRLAAEVLLAKTLGCDRLGVYMRFEEGISGEKLDAFRELVRRRGKGEPVAYLTGEKEFHSMTFRVGPGVLIPRPETETLVGAAVGEIRRRELEAPAVLDLGTGSGNVIISAAREIGNGTYVGVDASPEALVLARENIEALAGGLDVTLREGDWFAALKPGLESFDVILSNPPYIPSGEIDGLQAEISAYEPRAALDGGPDGLDAYRRIASGVAGFLREKGFIAIECGDGQADPILDVFGRAGYSGETRKDLSGSDRVIILYKRG